MTDAGRGARARPVFVLKNRFVDTAAPSVSFRRYPDREESDMSTRTTTKGGNQPGVIGSLQSFIRDTNAEIKKVSWPDQQTTRNLTLLVIAMSAILGAILGGTDAIFIRVWDWIPA
jgi:preprotein translocase SecE subunit